MALSPNDIRNYEFGTQMRGYHKEEVDEFLEKTASTLEESRQENLKLSMELDSVKTQLQGLRQFEDTIKSAAIDARRNADTTMENARTEAEATLFNARAEAEQIVGSKAEMLKQIESKIEQADLIKRAYLSKLQSMIGGHLEMARELAEEFPEKEADEEDSIEVTDSAEVDRKGMTTVGSQSKEPEPVATEEVNAASEIIEVSSSSDAGEKEQSDGSETPTNRNQVIGSKIEPEEEKPVDPELAAALSQYSSKKTAESQEPSQVNLDIPISGESSESKSEIDQPDGLTSGMVETTARAEDVPSEFIIQSSELDPNETNKVNAEPMGEHSQVLDADQVTASHDEPANPEKLAEELDKVAERFEEEMDKAASS